MGVKKRNCIKKNTIPTGKLNQSLPYYNVVPSVISGNPLKTYSVVVGSFLTQANAEGQKARLQGSGYDARVVKTNETINGQTGWFRVIASSFDDKASAAQSRDALKGSYPGAWLLYRK